MCCCPCSLCHHDSYLFVYVNARLTARSSTQKYIHYWSHFGPPPAFHHGFVYHTMLYSSLYIYNSAPYITFPPLDSEVGCIEQVSQSGVATLRGTWLFLYDFIYLNRHSLLLHDCYPCSFFFESFILLLYLYNWDCWQKNNMEYAHTARTQVNASPHAPPCPAVFRLPRCG